MANQHIDNYVVFHDLTVRSGAELLNLDLSHKDPDEMLLPDTSRARHVPASSR